MAGRYWPGGQPPSPDTDCTAEPPALAPAPVPDIAVVVFYEENSLRLSLSRCTCSCVTTVLSYLDRVPGFAPSPIRSRASKACASSKPLAASPCSMTTSSGRCLALHRPGTSLVPRPSRLRPSRCPAGDQPALLLLQGEDHDADFLPQRVQPHGPVQPHRVPSRQLAVRHHQGG